MLHFRQPYVHSTDLLNETPYAFRAAPSWANKGGYHGCTPEQIWVWNVIWNVFSLIFLNQRMAWVFSGVESTQEVLQLSQSTKPPLKVLGCLFQQTLILLFLELWWVVNVDDLVDELGCWWGVYLMIWTAWEVRKSGELGRREFHAAVAVGGLKMYLLGVFRGDFSDGSGWGVGCCRGDCVGGCCGVTFGDDWWASFSVGVLGWVQSFIALVSSLSLRLFRFVEVSICTTVIIWLCVKRTSNVHKDRT